MTAAMLAATMAAAAQAANTLSTPCGCAHAPVQPWQARQQLPEGYYHSKIAQVEP